MALNNDGLVSIKSSFNTAIPISSLGGGTVHISIILESNGQFYSTREVGGFEL